MRRRSRDRRRIRETKEVKRWRSRNYSFVLTSPRDIFVGLNLSHSVKQKRLQVSVTRSMTSLF
jgi:hypothetical protein